MLVYTKEIKYVTFIVLWVMSNMILLLLYWLLYQHETSMQNIYIHVCKRNCPSSVSYIAAHIVICFYSFPLVDCDPQDSILVPHLKMIMIFVLSKLDANNHTLRYHLSFLSWSIQYQSLGFDGSCYQYLYSYFRSNPIY